MPAPADRHPLDRFPDPDGRLTAGSASDDGGVLPPPTTLHRGDCLRGHEDLTARGDAAPAPSSPVLCQIACSRSACTLPDHVMTRGDRLCPPPQFHRPQSWPSRTGYPTELPTGSTATTRIPAGPATVARPASRPPPPTDTTTVSTPPGVPARISCINVPAPAAMSGWS